MKEGKKQASIQYKINRGERPSRKDAVECETVYFEQSEEGGESG